AYVEPEAARELLAGDAEPSAHAAVRTDRRASLGPGDAEFARAARQGEPASAPTHAQARRAGAQRNDDSPAVGHRLRRDAPTLRVRESRTGEGCAALQLPRLALEDRHRLGGPQRP